VTGLVTGFRLGRGIWTVAVTAYFLIFFRNFFADALPGAALLPLVFSYLLVSWLAVEYYFGSPFFQSGAVESSAVWRGVFAFFVYPFLGYVAADAIWWHVTQIPVHPAVAWSLGVLLFAAGVYIRLDTLLGLVALTRADRLRSGGTRLGRRFAALRFQQVCRHPRYLATLLQLVGAALVFRSWGGLALVGVLGLPLILLQVRYEDRRLKLVLKSDYQGYAAAVPLLWPRPGRRSGPDRPA